MTQELAAGCSIDAPGVAEGGLSIWDFDADQEGGMRSLRVETESLDILGDTSGFCTGGVEVDGTTVVRMALGFEFSSEQTNIAAYYGSRVDTGRQLHAFVAG